MADPVLRPLRWPREFHVYAEQNGMHDVLMEVFRELLMWKPSDPLSYIRDEIPRVAKSIYSPRVFILGPYPAAEVGQNIADSSQAVYLTLENIIDSAPAEIRPQVIPALYDYEPDQCLCNLLVAVINRRLAMSDCMKSGYVLYGFPRTKTESMYAQQNGLLPRQVFVLLPPSEKSPANVLEISSISAKSNLNSNDNDNDNTGPRKKRSENPGKIDPNPSRTRLESEADAMKLNTAKMSIAQMQAAKEYFNLKDVASAYSPEICRVVSHDHWSTIPQPDLEAEFLGMIIAKKPSGAPWIPKIVVIGPPGAGKSTMVDHLVDKFGVVKVDWMETVRSFAQWTDDTACEAKLYLENLTPLSEDAIVTMLTRRLSREDALSRGWILEGFPESSTHAKIMEDLAFTPNRVFLVQVAEAVSQKRTGARRRAIQSRRINNNQIAVISSSSSNNNNNNSLNDQSKSEDERNMRLNPHSEYAVQKRYELFTSNLDDMMTFYGTKMIYVDGTQPVNLCKEFVEASVIRPPTLRF